MNSFLFSLMFWGQLGLITALVVWSRALKRRLGTWRWPAWGPLVIALIIAITSAIGGFALFNAHVHSDAASRATWLAHGISEGLNVAGYSVVVLCLTTCAYYGYRFIAKPPL